MNAAVAVALRPAILAGQPDWEEQEGRQSDRAEGQRRKGVAGQRVLAQQLVMGAAGESSHHLATSSMQG